MTKTSIAVFINQRAAQDTVLKFLDNVAKGGGCFTYRILEHIRRGQLQGWHVEITNTKKKRKRLMTDEDVAALD